MEISATTLAIIVALTAALSSLAGVVITSIFNLQNAKITKKSEELRHQRELVINAAIENWKQQMEIYKHTKQSTRLVPLDAYIIHMLKFSEVILNSEITPANIEEKMKEVEGVTRAIMQHAEKVTEERKLQHRT
jgi:L-cystine uptake protein TcyP (sodium:dicarboxylate symporter family)